MRHGIKILAAVLAVASLFLCACGMKTGTVPDGARLEKYSRIIPDAFDTVTTVSAWCGSQEQFNEIFQITEDIFTDCNKLFDIYNDYPGINNIKSINDAAGKEPVKAEARLIDFLEFAKNICVLTDGYVNIAMGSVLKLWHEAREFSLANPDDPVLPDDEALKNAGRHCSIDSIVIDRNALTVFIDDSEVSIDVGALAKGYATELAAKALSEKGYSRISIDAGGNIRLIGEKPSGNWNIAVSNPDRDSSNPYAGTVSVSECAIVTSGIYQRYYVHEGRCYHHIIDRDTLYPEERFKSVTVIYPDSALADAFSTALFNMPFEQGEELVLATDGLEAMWIYYDNNYVFSDGFKAVYKYS